MTERTITLQLHAPDILSKKLLDRRQELVFQGYEGLSLSDMARIVILEAVIVEHQQRQVGNVCKRCQRGLIGKTLAM